MNKFGVKFGATFELDKLWDGGFQAAVYLKLGVSKGGWDQTTLRDELDLVRILGISGVECESEDLKGKKCFVVGTKESPSCKASNTGNEAGDMAGAQQAQQWSSVAAAVAAAATTSAVLADL